MTMNEDEKVNHETQEMNLPESAKPGQEAIDARKPEVIEKEKTTEAAKKIEKDPNLKYNHPLMNCEMSLLEISHRTIEVVEKYKLRLVGDSDGEFEKDKEKFKDFLFDTLVKFRS